MIPRRRIQRKWGRKKNFWKNLFSREGEQWRSREQRRVNANFIRCSVWPASPSRVVSNESRHPWKNFSIRRTEGWERFQSPIVIENGGLIDLLFLPFVFVSLLPKGETFIPYRVIKVGAGGRAIWKIDATNVTYPWLGDSTRSRCTCPRSDAVFNRSRRIIPRVCPPSFENCTDCSFQFFRTVWMKITWNYLREDTLDDSWWLFDSVAKILLGKTI